MSGCSRDGGFVRRAPWVALAVLALLAVTGRAARAADIETRDFHVYVAGKHSGDVHMTIHRQDNGTMQMRCDTDIKVNILIGSYKFIYRGLEVWKDNRLLRLDSNTDDNNKRYIVSAAAEANGIRVKVNNAERVVKGDVWSSSYWCLPDARFRNGEVTILDADNGKDFVGKLQFVAAEKVRVGAQEVVLHHYRLTGKVTIDLWYDGTERLVRQEWVEQGQKTLMDLHRVRR